MSGLRTHSKAVGRERPSAGSPNLEFSDPHPWSPSPLPKTQPCEVPPIWATDHAQTLTPVAKAGTSTQARSPSFLQLSLLEKPSISLTPSLGQSPPSQSTRRCYWGWPASPPQPFLLPPLPTHGSPVMASSESTDTWLHPSRSKVGKLRPSQGEGFIPSHTRSSDGEPEESWTPQLLTFQCPLPAPSPWGQGRCGCPFHLASSPLYPTFSLSSCHSPWVGEEGWNLH